jgi:HPt (histidine-containing phosphotransfer) domain-containing protein
MEGLAMMRAAASIESRTKALLASMWVKNRPLMMERMEKMERVSAALDAGTLAPEMRAEALGLAHKLAGSLGMFGFDEGTRIARELEMLLEVQDAVDAERVGELVRELRGKVFGEV